MLPLEHDILDAAVRGKRGSPPAVEGCYEGSGDLAMGRFGANGFL
jgi:hypothetical protein